jgi:HK97 family phage prohead protease
MKRRNAPRTTPDGFEPGSIITRFVTMQPSTYDSRTRTVDAVITTGAPVRRFGIVEELSIDPAAIDLRRTNEGRMVLLWNHNQDMPLGNVESVRFESNVPLARLRFAETPEGRDYEGRVARGEITQVSMGYRVTSWTLRAIENETEIWRADRWELYEVSLVSVPADPAAVIRSAAETAAAPAASHQENDDMRRNASPAPGAPAAEPTVTPAPVAPVAPAFDQQRTAPEISPVAPAPQADLIADRARSTEITRLAQEHGIDQARSLQAVNSGESLDSFRAFVLDQVSQRQRPANHVRVEQDETETRRLGMQEAITRGLGGGAGEVSARALPYMELSLVALAAERLGERRVPENFGQRQQLLERAMHTTSDFPIILESALNVSLARRYTLAQPTYREFSTREDFTDFRPHTSVSIGDFPMLEQIREAGEIKFGTVGEKKETVAVSSYARGLRFSRQLLVNDRLGALGDVLAQYGQSVALGEEIVAYAVLGLNSGDGPALLEGAANMFTTTRTNKAGTATAINEAGVSAARAAMRKYKSIDGNTLLYNAPSIILCSPDKETEAEKFVSTIIPAQTGNVNPFAGKLRVVVGNMLSGNGWWLFADPSVRSNFRWGLLQGFAAPRVRMDEPFGSQGMAVTVEHDFGFGGIDWRAGYRNAGA